MTKFLYRYLHWPALVRLAKLAVLGGLGYAAHLAINEAPGLDLPTWVSLAFVAGLGALEKWASSQATGPSPAT